MPWWNREIVRRTNLTAGASPVHVDSDPVAVTDGARAAEARGFLEVERIDALAEVRVIRSGGASSDDLRPLDVSPILTMTAAGVDVIPWPLPPPACLRTRIECARTGGVGSVTAVVRVIQTCRSDR
jgi:hypothetical protein